MDGTVPPLAWLLLPQAIRDVQRFSHPAFAHRFKAIAQRAALSKPFRHLVQDTLGERAQGWLPPRCFQGCSPLSCTALCFFAAGPSAAAAAATAAQPTG